MKFYVYISDTKVDMLYSQISQTDKGLLKKIATELRIDLKIFGAELGTTIKKDQIEQTRYSKLQVILRYIEKREKIGTVDAPETFFRGTLPMYWGDIWDGVVYFTGSTKQTIVGLGGSLHHVIGNHIGTTVSTASSFPFLLAVLAKELRLDPSPIHPDTIDYYTNSEVALMAVEDHFEKNRGPGQQLEFLATRYLSAPSQQAEQGEPTQVLLGSPIYVALAT